MTEPHGNDAGRAEAPGDGWTPSSEHHPEIDWVAAERSPEFRELVAEEEARSSSRRTIFFLAWYFGFVVLAGYAPDFMGEEFLRRPDRRLRAGAVPVRDDLGPRRAGTCARPTASSTRSPSGRRSRRSRSAHRRRRPLRLGRARRERRGGDAPMTFIAADVNELALSIFGVVVAITLVVTYWASKRVTSATDFWAAGRGITGVQNGFAIAGDYMSAASLPRHRRPDLPVRLRRLPVLRRLPGRVPDRAVPARRADAQLGQVHDRRRALVPAERAAGALGGGARNAGRGRPST